MGPLKEILRHLYDVQGLIQWGGTALVCAIVFIETGLFAGFFLPGDSLLVTAGVFAAAGRLDLHWLLPLVSICAIIGDQLGYIIGRQAGERLYRREDSRFFKKQHLERAHAFYEKYGGKTVILARFVPIIRTLCPPVTGAARMSYFRYLAYDIFGGIFWVSSMVLGGFILGSAVPHIENKIHWVIAVVVLVSLIPVFLQAWKLRRKKAALPLPAAPPQKD